MKAGQIEMPHRGRPQCGIFSGKARCTRRCKQLKIVPASMDGWTLCSGAPAAAGIPALQDACPEQRPAVPCKCFRRIGKAGYNGKKYFPPMKERQEALNAVKTGVWRKLSHIAVLKARRRCWPPYSAARRQACRRQKPFFSRGFTREIPEPANGLYPSAGRPVGISAFPAPAGPGMLSALKRGQGGCKCTAVGEKLQAGPEKGGTHAGGLAPFAGNRAAAPPLKRHAALPHLADCGRAGGHSEGGEKRRWLVQTGAALR